MNSINSTTIIYARKSTESEDRQALSIDSQIDALTEHAYRAGLKVSGIFREAQSAKEPGRPVFKEMLSFVEENQICSILCWKLDRLARNPIDGASIIWALEKNKISQVDTPQQSYSNSANDKFWMQLEFGMAKKYVDDLSDNTKRGLKAKLNLGWRPGTPPVGYLNDTLTKTIVSDATRFGLVRKLWDYMLTGSYNPHQLREIADSLLHLSSKQGKSDLTRPLSAGQLYKLFRNPFYYGLIKYSDQFFPGAHVPMISKAEFDRVQSLLCRRGKGLPKRLAFRYSGLLKSGACGRSLTAERKVNRFGSEYVYYHCTRRSGPRPCNQRAVEEQDLERQLVRQLGFLLKNSSDTKQPQLLNSETHRFLDGSDVEKRNVLHQLDTTLTVFDKKVFASGIQHAF